MHLRSTFSALFERDETGAICRDKKGNPEPGKRYGVELKCQDAPRLTPSMRTALDDLGLEHLTVLYPGEKRYELERRVTVAPLGELATRGAAAVIPGRGTGRARGRKP